MKNKINVAIVGFGNIANERHRYAIPKMGGNICCIIDPALTETPIKGIPIFKSLKEAKDSDIKFDATSICTPPNTHAEIAKEALEYGLHVLLEKPPVLEISELDELEELAKEKGNTLFLSYHTASSPAVYKLQEILRKKKVIQIEASFFEEVTMWHNINEWIFDKSKSGGGITMDIGINAFSAICRTMPKAFFKLIDCDLVADKNYPVDTKAKIVFEDTVSGAKGVINLNWFNGRDNTDVRKIKYTTKTGAYYLNLTSATLYEEKENVDIEIEIAHDQEYEIVYKEFYEAINKGKSYTPREEIIFIKNVYALDAQKKLKKVCQ